MLWTIPILFFLSIGIIQGTFIKDESCEAQIIPWGGPCSGAIVVSRLCQSGTFHLEKTPFKPCDALSFMWSYPINNLTAVIETPFTQQHQSYSINLNNGKDYDIRKYVIVNGEEIEIKSSEDVIVLNSDSNYQIKLKFQAETTISYYASSIAYNVTKS